MNNINYGITGIILKGPERGVLEMSVTKSLLKYLYVWFLAPFSSMLRKEYPAIKIPLEITFANHFKLFQWPHYQNNSYNNIEIIQKHVTWVMWQEVSWVKFRTGVEKSTWSMTQVNKNIKWFIQSKINIIYYVLKHAFYNNLMLILSTQD